MRRALATMLLAVLASCGGDTATGTQSLSGTFTLKTVAGSALPARIYQAADGTIDVTAGIINFNPDKTWSGDLTYRAVASGGATQSLTTSDHGTFRQNGSAVVIHDDLDGAEYTGTWSANVVSLTLDFGIGVPFAVVFEK